MDNFKRFSFLSAFLLASPLFYAQAFDDGTNLFFIGFGLPASQSIQKNFDQYKNYIDYNYKNYGTGVAKYERGLSKYFGMGLNFEYSNASVTYKYDDVSTTFRYQKNISSNVFGFYGRLNGHYSVGDKFDIYGGVGLGYLYTINKYADTNPNVNASLQRKSTVLDFDYQLSLGLRYMVKERMGLFAEVGHTTTICQLGIVFKF